MIIEGLVSTLNDDGTLNLSPMGAIVDHRHWETFELRPFESSRTHGNLRRSGAGVLHLTDDVLLYARAIAGVWDEFPETVECDCIAGGRVVDAEVALEFTVVWAENRGGRSVLKCQTVQRHRGRDFMGFNRARHAVIEAAILVSRQGIIPAEEISRQLQALETIVDKTGGPGEHAAWKLLVTRINVDSPS